MNNLFKRYQKDKRGLASIIVVLMLTVVITLLSLGFSKLMDRATQQSLGSNLGASADYAAQSGINDVASYLKTTQGSISPNCKYLLQNQTDPDTGKQTPQPFSGSASILSTDIGGSTRYTCILINRNPTDVSYQNILPFKSQTIVVTPDKSPAQLLISWQSSDPNLKQLPDNNDKTLYDETTWANKAYEPLLRLTLYQVPKSLETNKVGFETYYLYPNKQPAPGDPAGIAVDRIDDAANAAVTLQPVHCGAQNLQLKFVGKADFDCNVVLYNLDTTQDWIYYVRLTPYYAKADVKIQANDENTKSIDLGASQYDVDVTAKSSNAVKRLRASITAPFSESALSVLTSTDDLFPEYGLQTANTLCKRLIVDDNAKTVKQDPGSSSYCNTPWLGAAPIGPHITFTADSYSLTYKDETTTLRWAIDPDTPAVSCTGSGGTFGKKPSKNPKSGKEDIGPLNLSQTYTLSCTDAAGKTSIQSLDVNVDGPPKPKLEFTAGDSTIQRNTSTKLTWNVTGGPATWCWATGGPWGSGQFLPANQLGGGTISTGSLANSDPHLSKAYKYTMRCGNNSDDYAQYFNGIDSCNIPSPPDPCGYATSTLAVVVTVIAQYPFPVVKLSASPNPATYNSTSKLSWDISGGAATWCWGWGGSWGADEAHGKFLSHLTGPNSETLSNLTTAATYTIHCGNNTAQYQDCGNSCASQGGYQTPNSSVDLKVNKPPKIIVKISGGSTADNVTGGTAINCSNSGNTGTCSESYTKTTSISLTAKAKTPNVIFDHWEGSCSGSKATCALKVDNELTVTAVFKQKPKLTLTVIGFNKNDLVVANNFTCSSNQKTCTHTYDVNDTDNLFASPVAGSRFSSWSGDCSGSDPSCDITMDGNKTVTATFVKN